MIGYELKNNKWTPKPTKRKEEESTLKKKEPSRGGSGEKIVIPKIEGFEMAMLGFKCKIQCKSYMLQLIMWSLIFIR